MMRLLRTIGLALAVGIISFSSIVVLYDRAIFQEHKRAIDKVLLEALPTDRDPPQIVFDILHSPKQFDATVLYVANRFLVAAHPERQDTPVHPLIDQLMWTQLLRYHYSDKDIVGLYCSIAPLGKVEGLTSISRDLFGLPPGELEAEQLAFVLASIRSPTLLRDDRGRLELIAQALLHQTEAP